MAQSTSENTTFKTTEESIERLFILVQDHIYCDYTKALEYAQQAYQASELYPSKPHLAIKSLHILSTLVKEKAEAEAREYLRNAFRKYDEEIAIRSTISDDERKLLLRLQLTQATFYAEEGKFSEALDLYRMLLIDFNNFKEFGKVVTIYIRIGQVLSQQEKLSDALESFLEALAIVEKNNLQALIGICCSNIGTIYSRMNNVNQAEEFYKKAVAAHIRNGNRLGEAIARRNIIDILLEKDLAQEAIYHLNIVKMIFLHTSNQEGLVFTEHSMGIALGKLNRYKECLERLFNAIEISQNQNIKNKFHQISSIHLSISNIYSKLQNYDHALKHLIEANICAEKINSLILQYHAYQKIAEIYGAKKDYQKAYEYQCLYTKIFNDANVHEQTLMSIKIRSSFDIKSLKDQASSATLKSHKLESEVERKNQELAAFALGFNEMNKLIHLLKEELQKTKEGNSLSYQSIITKIESNENNLKKHRDIFLDRFQSVHPEFNISLKNNYPALTPTERMICGFIKLNLSNKEIADNLYLSVRTIENHRMRIRKKMNLSNSDSLYQQISAL